MISANLTNAMRREVYRRDHYRCAICDSPKFIQIHHLYKRSMGGANHPMNLITLCMDCHTAIHGRPTWIPDGWSVEEMKECATQAAHEYLADYYAPDWYPWDG